MNKVLVVIDAQEDFTYGALKNDEAIKALPTIHDIVEYAEKNDFKVIFYTQDTHYGDYLRTQEGKNLPVEHCLANTSGWQIRKEVFPKTKPRVVLSKYSFGYTGWPGWHDIYEADEIWMCGFCTDICVSANFQLLKAYYPEVPIVIIEDACAGVTPELHEAALKVMKSCQAEIIKWDELKKRNDKNA